MECKHSLPLGLLLDWSTMSAGMLTLMHAMAGGQGSRRVEMTFHKAKWFRSESAATNAPRSQRFLMRVYASLMQPPPERRRDLKSPGVIAILPVCTLCWCPSAGLQKCCSAPFNMLDVVCGT